MDRLSCGVDGWPTPCGVTCVAGSHHVTRLSFSWPLALVLLVVLLVYGPGAGAGFIKDDFTWVLRAQHIVERGDWGQLVRAGDFFRPVVTVSFAANYAVCGTWAPCYGWTNLLLAVGAALLLGRLGVALGLSAGASMVGAGTWLLNWHGINMAVLWVSGRTALLLIVFSLGAALSVVRGRWLGAAVCVLLALGSKEEAVLLPGILLALAWGHPSRVAWPGPGRLALALGVPLVIYAGARATTGALTPATAPSYYRFTFELAQVLRNVAEYADRSTTVVAVVVLVAWMFARRRVTLTADERAIALVGCAWLVLGFALTVWLPVRSSLYACFPSLGSALAGSAIVAAVWRAMPAERRRAALALAVIGPFVLLPVYHARNARLVGQGRLATRTSEVVGQLASTVPDGGVVWLHDDRAASVDLDGAFGSAIDDAAALMIGRGVRLWVDPPLTDFAAANVRPPSGAVALRLRLKAGDVIREPGS